MLTVFAFSKRRLDHAERGRRCESRMARRPEPFLSLARALGALTICVACGGPQGGTSARLEDRTGTTIPQATTSAGIDVDVFKYGTEVRIGTTVPQATTSAGIGVDAFKYGTVTDPAGLPR